jgi:hypothetical protein
MQGFTINSYDWCIANKMVNGKQCTIVWHMDDLKISHKDSRAVDGIIAALRTEYKKVGKMTMHRGKVHEYLGMTLDFTKPGKFIINIEKHLNKMMRDLPNDMTEK